MKNLFASMLAVVVACSVNGCTKGDGPSAFGVRWMSLDKDAKVERTSEIDSRLIAIAEASIKDQTRAPSLAKLGPTKQYKISPTRYCALGSVIAQNGFGAYLERQWVGYFERKKNVAGVGYMAIGDVYILDGYLHLPPWLSKGIAQVEYGAAK